MVLFQIRQRLLRRDEADPLKPRSDHRAAVPNSTLTEALLEESITAMDGSLETGGMGGNGEQKWWEH